VFALSGKLKTLDGTFEVNSEGAQIGEMTPMGQLVRKGKHGIGIVAVYPPEFAKAKAVFGK
jgi:branched-chain amino acid transport system substrate-binding protein